MGAHNRVLAELLYFEKLLTYISQIFRLCSELLLAPPKIKKKKHAAYLEILLPLAHRKEQFK